MSSHARLVPVHLRLIAASNAATPKSVSSLSRENKGAIVIKREPRVFYAGPSTRTIAQYEERAALCTDRDSICSTMVEHAYVVPIVYTVYVEMHVYFT